ncbi:peptidylprolyl isomerase, partial [bacterium]|nr:peptidylprolyl isomerase [bacterium]
MNRLYHTLFVFLFLTAFAGGNILYSQEVIDSIAAVVDDEIILESEISYGISTLLLESGKKYPSEAEVMELRNQVLNAYIIQKVLLAKALEETLFVEDRIIEKELQRKMDVLIGQIGSEEELVKYFNKPMRLIKREMSDGVRDGLLIEQLKGSQISRVRLRRPEIVEFFEEHKDILPVQPEEVEVSHILLEVKPSEESKAEKMAVIGGLRDQLIAGADFDSLAKLNSEDFSAEDGGRLGFTTRGDLVQSYEEAAFLLKPGEVSEPIESPYGLHLIKQIERQGERISTQHILIKLAPSESDWEIA